MFRVIKRVSIYLLSMPASLAQWHGEIGAFYNNTLTFSKISIFYLLLSLSYGSMLLLLIINSILNGMFFHFKKCKNINIKTGVYLFTTIYLLIILNLLEYLWVGSQSISLSSDIEINHGPKLNALFWGFFMSLEFKQHISTNVYKSFSSISIHFCPQI